MPNTETNPQNSHTAEGFVGSLAKYSISTVVNVLILGLSMVLTGLFVTDEVLGQVNIFLQWTNTVMTIAILGLDQALIRFYNEPPGKLTQNGLFRLCFFFSAGVVAVAGVLGSTALLSPIYSALQFSMVGPFAVPLLFVNALFYMVARYFNVLYRMEGNILVYTVESVLMQFFYKLFYLLGAFIAPQNPAPAMMLCSTLGLGAFALVFAFLRRGVLRPKLSDFKQGAYKTILPYGFAIAPTAVFVTLNNSIAGPMLTAMLGEGPAGTFAFAAQLSNAVTMIQLGFASFWGPYMFANYKTQQPRIKRVHNYLNLAILCFFALLIAFEDILFLIFRNYTDGQAIFPMLMLSAVFTILCETTVYGNYIARRPIFDTIGIGLSFVVNTVLIALLVPRFGLYGAAIASAAANLVMFLFRTLTAQRFYSSIETPGKTVLAILLAVLLAAAGTAFAWQFWAKLAASVAAIVIYCLLYRSELIRLVALGLSMLKRVLPTRKG